NNKSVLSFNYNYLLHDGSLGLLARAGNASFDNVLIRGDDQAYAGGGAPQLAAFPATAVAAGNVLVGTQLAPVVEAAIERWAASPLLDGDDSLLRQASVIIADLPDQMMGQTIGSSIVIDPTAAGHGWFVDATPLDDAEFSGQTADGQLVADAHGPASGRMDLETVVMHELGHIVGLADLDALAQAGNLMATWLVPRLPPLPHRPRPNPQL